MDENAEKRRDDSRSTITSREVAQAHNISFPLPWLCFTFHHSFGSLFWNSADDRKKLSEGLEMDIDL